MGRRRSPAGDAPQVGADQLVDGLQNALFGDAHQHDGLLVLDQLEAGQHTFRIDADEHLDRFSGIADRIGEIGIQVHEALQLIAAIGRYDRRLALRGTETVGAREEVGRGNLRQVTVQVGSGRGVEGREHAKERQREECARRLG
ncbi:hypothetical protein ABIF41_007339 [Bradyrhizobium japonicum]